MIEARGGDAATVAFAYAHCSNITRSRARNFYYGIRLLPRPERRAVCAVYAFARRVDDIGDGSLPAAEKLGLLTQARRSLQGSPRSPDPVVVAVLHAASRFPIPMDAFADLITGIEMDVRSTRYRTFEELSGYCRRVAGSIGRLSIGVLGTADTGQACGLADTLGTAMQVTNILRDIREDASRGRVYLPSVDLARFGCLLAGTAGSPPSPGSGGAWFMAPGFADLIRFQAARGARLFDEGLGILALLDRRSAAGISAMCGNYCRLLDRIARRPHEVLAGRMSLPASERATIAARALIGAPAVPASRFGVAWASHLGVACDAGATDD